MNTMTMVRTMDDLGFRRPASLADWLTYPDRLSVEQSAFLVGVSTDLVENWIDTGAVDAFDAPDGSTLVDKASLREFWDLVHEWKR